jgi:phenylacetic acid degradation operon negative regulatory protein
VRTLLIHAYRRVLLRDPLLPAALLPLDWPGAAAMRYAAISIGSLTAVPSGIWRKRSRIPIETFRRPTTRSTSASAVSTS